jgi:hypothetical protein
MMQRIWKHLMSRKLKHRQEASFDAGKSTSLHFHLVHQYTTWTFDAGPTPIHVNGRKVIS